MTPRSKAVYGGALFLALLWGGIFTLALHPSLIVVGIVMTVLYGLGVLALSLGTVAK